MKAKKLLGLSLIFVLLLGGAAALYERLSTKAGADQLVEQNPEEQEDGSESAQDEGSEMITAPDFSVYDAEGNEVKLSDFFGKPIVLNFWASWCSPCKEEMQDFEEAHLELQEEVQFLMVNLTDGSRETVDSALAYIEEQGFTFPVFYDTDTDAAQTYHVYSIPASFFIDAQGYAIARASGAIDRDTLKKGIDMITS